MLTTNKKFIAVEMWAEKDKNNEESLFVHLASSFDKAIKWIEKNGKKWDEDPYKFVMYETELDKSGDMEDFDVLVHVDKHGEIIKVENRYNVDLNIDKLNNTNVDTDSYICCCGVVNCEICI